MNRSIKTITQVIETLLGKKPGSVCAKTENDEDYAEYLKNSAPTAEELEAQKRAENSGLPLLAVHIFGKDERKLKRTTASLVLQTYNRWITTANPGKDKWDFLLYMQAGDTLAPNALYEFAKAAKDSDLIYCDEDCWSKDGRCDPFFKWQLSMYTQLSFDMLGSAVLVSRKLFEKAGELQSGGATDRYAYNLKCAKHSTSPKHIPKVLYTLDKRESADFSSRADVQSAAEKGEIILPGKWRGSFICEAQRDNFSGAVIILSLNDCDRLMNLLMSMDKTPMPKSTKIVIADRGSTDRRTLRFYEILENNKAAKVLRLGNMLPPAAFNRALEKTGCEAAVLMHSCVEAMSPNWLNDLLCQTMRRGIAAAGPKLLDEQGRLLHTGTVVGIGGWEGSPYRGEEEGGRSMRKRQFTETLRQVTALSCRCMMVNAQSFFNAGCFDESFEEVGYDTELCIRLFRKQLACMYVPSSVMRCSGGIEPIGAASQKDKTRCYDAMRPMLLKGDPFYSPNFDYAFSVPKAAAKPYAAITLNEKFGK